ncbi:hypothetical protein [Teichococcus vastitatis]|uniref:Uncharacterized protein n=1 Tax=Teichococcus vastitatis TaxID=2307076 RepID=A0ABS9W6E6_9PROT|nr:hypothetical protein [Pseudoroseomonas vastitatis]MCI0754866.1 hypothetical protein [Pseudoroseomonas vastitatis]
MPEHPDLPAPFPSPCRPATRLGRAAGGQTRREQRVRHLERSGFLVLKSPPARLHSAG